MTKDNMEISPEQAEAWLKATAQRKQRARKTRKRKSKFKVKWVRIPLVWIERLHAAGVGPATYHLAHVVLVENFKLDRGAIREIVLSGEVTGLSRGIRRKTVDNLVKLGFIRVKRRMGQAYRVTKVVGPGLNGAG